MSFFPRLFKPPAANCRTYSFFSSKPGGGRYFNSAKPPKPVISSGRAKVENGKATVASSDGTSNSTPGSGCGKVKLGGAEENTIPNAVDTARSTHSLPFTSSSPLASQYHHHIHPAISFQDFKLHYFFSLHRPLLLLSQSPSVIFESSSHDVPLVQSPEDISKIHLHSGPFPLLEDPPESSFEADADTARQLAHALVMNRVGGIMSWKNTLARLGLNDESTQGTGHAKECAQEWVTIHGDSTKRKKRKKMKKHKLKKRRRLTRMQQK